MTLKLRLHHVYRICGMTRDMWQVPHPRWGRPSHLIGIFVGTMSGSRTWFGFEIRVRGKEQGVIFMPESDLRRLTLTDLGPYPGGDADVDHT